MSHIYDYRNIPEVGHAVSGYHAETLQADFFRELRANLWATDRNFERASRNNKEAYAGSSNVEIIMPLFPDHLSADKIYFISTIHGNLGYSLNGHSIEDKELVQNVLGFGHLDILDEGNFAKVYKSEDGSRVIKFLKPETNNSLSAS